MERRIIMEIWIDCAFFVDIDHYNFGFFNQDVDKCIDLDGKM